MKKLFSLMFIVMLVLLGACGGGNSSEDTNRDNENEEETMELTVDSLLTAFQKSGLEAEDGGELTRDDFGMAPMKADKAKRLLIPSLGEDAGGRIFRYDNQADLNEMKSYYDDLGKESAMFYSHTAVRDDILLQISGDLSDDEFKKYKKVLNTVGSGDLPKFEQKEAVTFSEAAKGDAITDDDGTYTVKKVTKPSNPTHQTGSITFSLNKVLLATFKPNEESASFFDSDVLNVAVMLVESENKSEDTVSFHPFSTTATTNTKGQYDAQSMLNKGESEHVGQVTQEFRIAFNLEDENLDEINEMTFLFDKPSKDSMSFGEEVTIDVAFD